MQKICNTRIKLKNNQELIIRCAKPIDAEELLAYIDNISSETDFLTFGVGEYGLSFEGQVKHIKQINSKKNSIFLVGTVNDRIIATLYFENGPRKRISHVGDLGVTVLKSYWRSGVGFSLIKAFIEWAKSTKHIKRVNVGIHEDNHRSQKLCKKIGLKKCGTLERAFCIDGKFFNSIIMGINID